MQDSIIVYRNPMEKAFWDSIMSGDGVFTTIIVFIVVALVSWIGVYKVLHWIAKRMPYSKNTDDFCGIVASIIAGVSVWVVIVKIM